MVSRFKGLVFWIKVMIYYKIIETSITINLVGIFKKMLFYPAICDRSIMFASKYFNNPLQTKFKLFYLIFLKYKNFMVLSK